MAVFDYVAITNEGRRTRGVITADSARTARKQLRLQQLSPIELNENSKSTEAGQAERGSKISSNDLVMSTRQLAILIQSGTTAEEALRTLAHDTSKDSVKRTFLAIRNAVQQGTSLSAAMGAHKSSFPDYYRSVVASGQGAGRLGDVLERLALHLEKSRKLKRKLLSALIYPLVLCVVAVAVIVLLLIFVVPTVVEQFDTMGQELPPITRFVIGVSEFTQQWWWALLAGVIVASWGLPRVFIVQSIKAPFDGFLLRLPVLGKIFRMVNSARFARTFATLTGSGATITDGLMAAEGSVTNAVFKSAVRNSRRRIEEGASLNKAMKETGVFPSMLIHMIASGEAAGDLPSMAERAANYMEEELDNNATIALGLIEPLLIVLLAGAVGFIVLAIMLPILDLNTLVIGA